MCRNSIWAGWVISFCVGVWTVPSFAESDTRFHIGLDTSIYSNTSVDAENSVVVGGETSTVKTVASESQVGLPGATAVALGMLLNDHWDVGARFGYRSTTTKSGADATAPETENSTFTLGPYVGYLTAERGARARVLLGVTAGLGTGTMTTTIPATGGTTNSTSYESTLSSTYYGAFVGLRGFVGEMMSLDPSLMFTKTNTTYKSDGVPDVDLGGTSILLNVGFTFWTRGTEHPAQSSTVTPPPATLAAGDGAPTESTNAAEPAAASVERSDRITLPLGEGYVITILRDPGTASSATFVLRDETAPNPKTDCTQVALHASSGEDTVVAVKAGMASTSYRRFPVLKGHLDVDVLRRLAAAPIADNASEPDHWLDVCGNRWLIHEKERSRLKAFVARLPPSPAAEKAQEVPAASAADAPPVEATSRATATQPASAAENAPSTTPAKTPTTTPTKTPTTAPVNAPSTAPTRAPATTPAKSPAAPNTAPAKTPAAPSTTPAKSPAAPSTAPAKIPTTTPAAAG